jgi:hypothetical protein
VTRPEFLVCTGAAPVGPVPREEFFDAFEKNRLALIDSEGPFSDERTSVERDAAPDDGEEESDELEEEDEDEADEEDDDEDEDEDADDDPDEVEAGA